MRTGGKATAAIVGPGITTWSTAQYTSWAIERAAKGEPFTIWAPEEFVIPVLYYKEAGHAAVQLARREVADELGPHLEAAAHVAVRHRQHLQPQHQHRMHTHTLQLRTQHRRMPRLHTRLHLRPCNLKESGRKVLVLQVFDLRRCR